MSIFGAACLVAIFSVRGTVAAADDLDQRFNAPVYVVHITKTFTARGAISKDVYIPSYRKPDKGRVLTEDGAGGYFINEGTLVSGPHQTVRQLCAAMQGLPRDKINMRYFPSCPVTSKRGQESARRRAERSRTHQDGGSQRQGRSRTGETAPAAGTEQQRKDKALGTAIAAALILLLASAAVKAATSASTAASSQPAAGPQTGSGPAAGVTPTRDRVCDRGTDSVRILKDLGIYDDILKLDKKDPLYWQKLDDILKMKKNGRRVVGITFEGNPREGTAGWSGLVVVVREPVPQKTAQHSKSKPSGPVAGEEPVDLVFDQPEIPPGSLDEKTYQRRWNRRLRERKQRLRRKKEAMDFAARQYLLNKLRHDVACKTSAAHAIIEGLFLTSGLLAKGAAPAGGATESLKAIAKKALVKAVLKASLKNAAAEAVRAYRGMEHRGIKEIGTEWVKGVAGVGTTPDGRAIAPPGGLSGAYIEHTLNEVSKKLFPDTPPLPGGLDYGTFQDFYALCEIGRKGGTETAVLRKKTGFWLEQFLNRRSEVQDAIADVQEAEVATGLRKPRQYVK